MGNDHDALFRANVEQIEKLHGEATALLRQLIGELEEQENTFVRLGGAETGGHTVTYEFVEGDETQVERYASVLGIAVEGQTLRVLGF